MSVHLIAFQLIYFCISSFFVFSYFYRVSRFIQKFILSLSFSLPLSPPPPPSLSLSPSLFSEVVDTGARRPHGKHCGVESLISLTWRRAGEENSHIERSHVRDRKWRKAVVVGSKRRRVAAGEWGKLDTVSLSSGGLKVCFWRERPSCCFTSGKAGLGSTKGGTGLKCCGESWSGILSQLHIQALWTALQIFRKE